MPSDHPKLLSGMPKSPFTTPPETPKLGEFRRHTQAFMQLIQKHSGIVISPEQIDKLRRVLSARCAATASPSYGAYLLFLEGTNALALRERDTLCALFTVSETYFFRDDLQIEMLKTSILPALLKSRAKTKKLRLWSAGCSNGAEAYSLSILLAEILSPEELASWQIEILGTDLNPVVLAEAEKAEYGEWALRGVEETERLRFFERLALSDNRLPRFRVRQHYRECVTFQKHNFLIDNPNIWASLGLFDLILFRNVSIYFTRDIAQQVVNHLYNSLTDDGYLMTGQIEASQNVYDLYTRQVFNNGQIVYRRISETITSEPDSTYRHPKKATKPLQQAKAPVTKPLNQNYMPDLNQQMQQLERLKAPVTITTPLDQNQPGEIDAQGQSPELKQFAKLASKTPHPSLAPTLFPELPVLPLRGAQFISHGRVLVGERRTSTQTTAGNNERRVVERRRSSEQAALFEQAIQAFRELDFNKSRRALQYLLNKYPGNARGAYLLALLYTRRRIYEEAEAYCRLAIENDAMIIEAYCLLASILSSQGIFNETERLLLKASYIEPALPLIPQALAELYTLNGNPQKAAQARSRANQLQKNI